MRSLLFYGECERREHGPRRRSRRHQNITLRDSDPSWSVTGTSARQTTAGCGRDVLGGNSSDPPGNLTYRYRFEVAFILCRSNNNYQFDALYLYMVSTYDPQQWQICLYDHNFLTRYVVVGCRSTISPSNHRPINKM
jgi:hypothetical protein